MERSKDELIDFIKQHIYLEVFDTAIDLSIGQPLPVAYCINYQGHTYRLHAEHYFSLLSDKAEVLSQLILDGKKEEPINDD